MQKKKCKKCGKVKPVSEFYKHYLAKDGYQHACINCNNDSFVDRTGHKYGRLTVIERETDNSKRLWSGAYWRCQCDCGNMIVVKAADLRRGHTRSCGCLRKDTARLPKGEAAFNQVVIQMKGNAKTRGIRWELTREEVRHFTKQPCAYCGIGPSQEKSGKYYGTYTYNGLDRVDSNKGYVIDNIVSCCKRCNWAKGDMTTDEFYDWVARVHKHLMLGEYKK